MKQVDPYDLSNFKIKKEGKRFKVTSKNCGHTFSCADFTKYKSKQKGKLLPVCPICRKIEKTGNNLAELPEYMVENYVYDKDKEMAASKVCGHTFKVTGKRGLSAFLNTQRRRDINPCPVCRKINKALQNLSNYKKRVAEIDPEYEMNPIEEQDDFSKTGKISITHKKCGRSFKMRPNAFLSSNQTPSGTGNRCPHCFLNTSTVIDKIEVLLKEKGISFKKEVSYTECINPFTNRKLRFDFLLNFKNKDVLLEIDGHQHFLISKGWWGNNGDNFLAKNKYLDFLKNKFCAYNNIPLYRIPLIHLPDGYKDQRHEGYGEFDYEGGGIGLIHTTVNLGEGEY